MHLWGCCRPAVDIDDTFEAKRYEKNTFVFALQSSTVSQRWRLYTWFKQQNAVLRQSGGGDKLQDEAQKSEVV